MTHILIVRQGGSLTGGSLPGQIRVSISDRRDFPLTPMNIVDLP